MDDHTFDPKAAELRRFEVITGTGRRRNWSAEVKARIVAESLAPGVRVSEVARRHAKETLAEDPFSGTVLVFRAKRADRVKILVSDGTGLMLVSKRLEQGAFKWPPIMDGMMRLSPAQLAALVEGLDWTRVHVPQVTRPQATQ